LTITDEGAATERANYVCTEGPRTNAPLGKIKDSRGGKRVKGVRT